MNNNSWIGVLFREWSVAILLLATPAFAAGAKVPDARQALTQAQQAFDRGAFDETVRQAETAARVFAKAGEKKGQIEALLTLGLAEQSVGQHQAAVNTLTAAVTLAEKLGERSGIIRTKSSLGMAMAYVRKMDVSKSLLNESLELAKAEKDLGAAAGIQNNLGNLLAGEGQHVAALAAYAESASCAKRSGNDAAAAKAMANAAFTASQAGLEREAKEFLEAAKDVCAKVPASHDKAYLLILMGQTYRDLSKHSPKLLLDSHRAFSSARDAAESIQDMLAKSYALGYLAQLYENQGRFDESLGLTRQAVFAAQQVQSADGLYRWEWQTGRLLKAKGDSAAAIAAYHRSIASLQSIRNCFFAARGLRKTQTSFRESVGPVYFELADLLLKQADSLSDPERVQEALLAARETVEQLKSAELDDYFQDECVSMLRRKTVSIESAAKDTAVIYFITLPERTEMLVNLPSGLKRLKAAVGTQKLTTAIRELRVLLEKRTTHQYLTPSRKIYDWLIRPLERMLADEQVKTLVFVPDGALRTVPMAALHDGERFLIEKFAVAVTPGLTLMDPKPIKRANVQLLLNGISKAVQGFSALEHVPLELEKVQSLYRGRKFLDEEFCISRVEKEVTEERFGIVHIASHGQFSGDARSSFVLAYDGKLDLNKLEALIRPSQFRGAPVELLTLSACQTAAGDDRAALGLAGVAVKAGARSALATLWFVNDQSTAVLVADFYAELRNPSVSKANALRAAQLKLIADRRYRHPCYWAPYLIIGNWL